MAGSSGADAGFGGYIGSAGAADDAAIGPLDARFGRRNGGDVRR
jgi:hypothetical protein